MSRPAFRSLGLFVLPLALFVAACAAPPPADTPILDTTPDPTPVSMSENGICPDIPYQPLNSTRQNFSLAAEYYRNATAADAENVAARVDAFCASEVYLRWLIANDPLFTGGDPDDRNFLRLGSVFEFYADQVETDEDKRAYIDSSLTIRREGIAAMEAANVDYESYVRDLREGYIYYSNAPLFEDASQRQFEAFDRAFEAAPDSLDDWYLKQLFAISAVVYEDPLERADYIDTLVPYIDDAAYQSYATQIAELARTPPADPVGVGVTPDLATTLIEKYQADPQSLTAEERQQIFYLATRETQLVTDAGGDADAIQDTYFDEIVATQDVTDPGTLYALFVRSWRRGNTSQAEDYFRQAIANAASNAQRADFHYSRATRGYGSRSSNIARALEYQPSHGPALYTRAQDYARGIGSPSSVEGRAAYWCLADRFNQVAATGDPRVASAARSAAAGYNRAGPRSEDYFFKGWSRGQSVRVSSGSVSCTTRVR